MILEFPLPRREAANWGQVCQLSGRPEWEQAELEARNQLTEYLAYHHPDADRQWNDVTDRARQFLESELTPAFKRSLRSALGATPKSLVDTMQWDVLAALMEDAYADLDPPRFFTHLLTIYLAGHIPCGWEGGSFPEGTLIVY